MKLAGVYHSIYLTDVLKADVEKPVAWHFNSVNHLILDVKVCTISPIFGCNDRCKRQGKHLIFRIGTIHPHRLNDFLLFNFSVVSVFVYSEWLLTLFYLSLWNNCFLYFFLHFIVFLHLIRYLLLFFCNWLAFSVTFYVSLWLRTFARNVRPCIPHVYWPYTNFLYSIYIHVQYIHIQNIKYTGKNKIFIVL